MIGKNQIVGTARKAGAQVPEHVRIALARRFPDVRIFWENRQHRWVMVQVRPGERPWVIRTLRTSQGAYVAPTLANTVQHLDKIHPSRWAGPLAQQRFEAEMDQQWDALQQSVEDRDQPRRLDVADRIYDVFKPRTVITR